MEGRHFAVLSSIFLWCITYIIGFVIISNKFSNGILFSKIIANLKINKTILITTILLPFLAGVSYRIGGNIERGNSIAWGCYIESFSEGTLVLWILSGIILFLVMIFGLIKPNALKFQKGLDLFLAYTMFHLFVLFTIFVYSVFIGYFSGDLSGKNSSCW